VRFHFPIEFALLVAFWLWLAMKRLFQSLLDEALPHAGNGRQTHLQRLADTLIRPGRSLCALIGFEQNAGMQ
jgi:hypothetical protein